VTHPPHDSQIPYSLCIHSIFFVNYGWAQLARSVDNTAYWGRFVSYEGNNVNTDPGASKV